MKPHNYKLKTVSTMLGVSRDRIAYTLRNGTLPRRKRRYLHHWYTPEEIVLLADYFDVPVPEQFREVEPMNQER